MTRNAVQRWSRPELIVVATNFLEGPSLMLNAIDQAKLTGARILLVHVVECYRKALALSDPDGSAANLGLHSITAQMSQMSAEFQRQGIPCESIVLKGLPAEQIADLVRSRGAERVIVTTGKFSGAEKRYALPVAEKLAAVLDVPVCIIGRNVRGSPEFGPTPLRILVAASFHPASARCFRFACALAQEQKVRLALLHVMEARDLSDADKGAVRAESLRKLAALVAHQPRTGCKATFSIREGDPATEILAEAEATNPGYLILGATRDFIHSGYTAGRVVHGVVAEAKCPVFTIQGEVTVEDEEPEDAGRSAILRSDDAATHSALGSSSSDFRPSIQHANPPIIPRETATPSGSCLLLRNNARDRGVLFASQLPFACVQRTDL